MRFLLTVLIVLLSFKGFTRTPTKLSFAKSDTARRNIKKDIHFPEPANVNKLFYIQRDPNTNTLIYELNTNDAGELDTDNPLHVYWIRYAEKGQREELSYIQRNSKF